MHRVRLNYLREPVRKISDYHLQEMVRELKQHGQLKPLRVSGKVTIQDGVARYWAAIALGWTHIYVDDVVNDDRLFYGESAKKHTSHHWDQRVDRTFIKNHRKLTTAYDLRICGKSEERRKVEERREKRQEHPVSPCLECGNDPSTCGRAEQCFDLDRLSNS